MRGKMCCREVSARRRSAREKHRARETEVARESARGIHKREETQKRAKVHKYFFVQRK